MTFEDLARPFPIRIRPHRIRRIDNTHGVKHWAGGHSHLMRSEKCGGWFVGRVLDQFGELLYSDGPWFREDKEIA